MTGCSWGSGIPARLDTGLIAIASIRTVLLPPPTPFKVFVFAAGVFEVPVGSFTLAILIARVLRYFTVGYLAMRFGHYALPYLAEHKLQVAIVVAAFVVVSYLLSRLILRKREVATHEE